MRRKPHPSLKTSKKCSFFLAQFICHWKATLVMTICTVEINVKKESLFCLIEVIRESTRGIVHVSPAMNVIAYCHRFKYPLCNLHLMQFDDWNEWKSVLKCDMSRFTRVWISVNFRFPSHKCEMFRFDCIFLAKDHYSSKSLVTFYDDNNNPFQSECHFHITSNEMNTFILVLCFLYISICFLTMPFFKVNR